MQKCNKSHTAAKFLLVYANHSSWSFPVTDQTTHTVFRLAMTPYWTQKVCTLCKTPVPCIGSWSNHDKHSISPRATYYVNIWMDGFLADKMRQVVEKYLEGRISGNKHYWGGNLATQSQTSLLISSSDCYLDWFLNSICQTQKKISGNKYYWGGNPGNLATWSLTALLSGRRIIIAVSFIAFCQQRCHPT